MRHVDYIHIQILKVGCFVGCLFEFVLHNTCKVSQVDGFSVSFRFLIQLRCIEIQTTEHTCVVWVCVMPENS